MLSLLSKFQYNSYILYSFNIDIDINQKNFNFKNKPIMLIEKINQIEIKGIPYLCLTNKNIPILTKIFPCEKNKILDNSFIEISYLYLFNKEILYKNILPNIPFIYDNYCKIPNNSKCFSHIDFKKLNKISEIENYSNVLFCEYFKEQDIDCWFENNKIDEKDIKSIIFQVCFTLAVLQDKYKFMHNDLHPGNVLIDNINNNEKIQYSFYDNIYYINETKFIAKLWDFEFSNIHDKKYKIYSNPITFKIEYNQAYDIHKFLKGLLQIETLNDNIKYFIDSLYPKELLYSTDNNVNTLENTEYLNEGVLTLKALKDYDLPFPKTLLNHDYFKEYTVKQNKKYINFDYPFA